MATITEGYVGIDYGMGTSNADHATGIRYGVISQNSVMPEALDCFEEDYGDPHCPACGGDNVVDSEEFTRAMRRWASLNTWGSADYACRDCKRTFDSSEATPDEPIGRSYEEDGYALCDCLDSDIMVIRSPFYTLTQFCSPCVPGAGNLDTPIANGVKTYALGHEWFEDGEGAPYPVYRVADDRLITAEAYARLQRRAETRRRLDWEKARAAQRAALPPRAECTVCEGTGLVPPGIRSHCCQACRPTTDPLATTP